MVSDCRRAGYLCQKLETLAQENRIKQAKRLLRLTLFARDVITEYTDF